MDLVKIGFQINANGLKDANTEVDKLLDKVDNIGTKGKKASSDFESSQKKVKDSTQQVTKEVDKTSKALEKQKIIGDYLGKGLDKTTATSIASFKQLGATVSQTNEYISKQLNNKGLEQTRKELTQLGKEQQKQQEQQAKLVQDTVTQYEKLSNKSLGGGILDSIEQQNKGLEELKKQYRDQEKEQQKALDDIETARQKHFSKVQKDYEKQQQAIVDTQQKAVDKQVKAQNTLNESNQKAITLEQAKAKYVSQGYGKTDSTRLARLEVSGADVTTLNNYKSAIEATTRATQALNPAVEKVTTSHSNFLDQVKGIAIYAALSAAIYGVMTAMTNLAVATVKMADEYTSIQNRMKLYITDAKELGKVNSQLAQFSMENNVGLRETATLFSRLAPSMQKLGANTAAITTVVDAFGKSMRIGGATAMEAASATIQFSQAMASGKLAGDEFRSISEASPRFLKAIAEGSGIAADKLKEMSAAGALTTEVISKALLKEYPKLIEENKKLGITLEQGANALKTGFLVAFGEFNEGAGITKALGEAMTNLAQSMLTAAQGARQFGADVNKWFKDNANTINNVIEGFKVLASVVAAKYIVSVVAAIGSTAILTWNFVSLSAAIAGMSRTAFLGATALTALGNAAKGVALSTGGIVGLLTTVASAALIYTAFRDNAAEANAKLVEQADIVRMTKEEVEALTNAQKENLKVKTIIDMKEANKNIDEAEAKYLSMMDVLTGKSFGNTLPSSAEKLISQAADGTKAFDDVTVSLLNMGIISEKSAKQLFDQTGVIVTAKQEALKYGNSARLLGIDLEITGNKAHNATPAIAGFKSEVRGVGDEADIAGGKVRKFYQDLQTDTKKNILAFEITTKLDISSSTGNKVAEELSNRAAQEEGLKNNELITQQNKMIKLRAELLSQAAEFAKGAKSKAEVDQLKANTAEYRKQQSIYDNMRKSKPYVKVNPLSLLTPEETKIIKAYDASTSLSSNQTKADKEADKARKKQEADAERLRNANQKIVDKYDNQESTAIRLNEYLKAGVAYSVAKVASEGKYAKVYGDNLETARKIAKARQEVADIEESSKGREDSQNSLRKQFRDQQAIGDFMKEGYSYAVAQATVQSGFAVNADGIANANNRTLISLREQLTISEAESSYQQDLLDFVKSGLSVEEASAKVAIYRNKHLNQGLIITAEELAKAKQREQVDKSRLALELESNSYKEQATYLVQTTNNDLADIMAKHKGVSLQEAQTLQTRKDIVEKLREYNDLLEKQRTLAYDIENVNFDVFGDFGNPFKSALEGLNALIFGMNDLKTQYAEMYADIDGRIAKEEDGSKAQLALIQQKTNLEKNQVIETKKARDKAITSGLSLTKSLFKEESKGYKVVSSLEKAYQASKIAFALWEKKDTIKTLAIKVAGYAKDMITFIGGVTSKIAAQMGLNVVQAQGAVASAAQAPPPVGFASAAAMIALLAGIGIAISSSGSSGGSSYVDTSNQGTGTVFGDSEAQSASIANSIDILSDNSDLMLPLTSAMLRSLKNIESSIGGVTNLILRGDLGGDFSNLEFDGKLTGVVGAVDKTFTDSSKLMMNVFTLGLDKLLLGGALGNLAGGIVSTVLGGVFGKTSQKVMASGLYAGDQKLSDILSNGINLKQYADVKTTKKSWFSSSSSTRTQYASVDEELQQQFTLIFSGFYDTILSATDILGADLSVVQTNLENAVISIGKINLKGLSGEEIQEKLEAVFGAAADNLAKQAFGSLEDFQTVGEGYFETLVKVASAVEEAAYYTDRLNVTAIDYTKIVNKQADDLATEIIRQSYLTKVGISTIKGGMTDLVNSFDGSAEEINDFINTLEDLQEQLFMTGKSGDYLTSSTILGAGGLDSLASGLDAYFEMLSPAEQAAELTRRLTNEFAIFGKELPADVKAFRNLVSSIDITTEAGQKLYGQIIALAPEFNDLQDALDSANSDVNALVQSLRDLAEQARAARGETEQPRNLAYLRNEFNKASELALQGDTEAANRLISLGKDLMSVSKLYSVTGSDYAKDLAFIQGIATAVADLQESGLGTSISSDLTPSTGNTTTPVVETTNTTTDSELKGMREDLNAGLLAIAKFTQSIDARQDRWDYGDRLLVRVEQDGANDKIPVTTV